MARTFTKNTSNNMSLSSNTIGNILNGASAISFHLWAKATTFNTTKYNNGLFIGHINVASAGIFASVHDGTNAKLIVAGRSQAADSLKERIGTTVLSTGVWYSIG